MVTVCSCKVAILPLGLDAVMLHSVDLTEDNGFFFFEERTEAAWAHVTRTCPPSFEIEMGIFVNS